jgi:rhamnosyltransferase
MPDVTIRDIAAVVVLYRPEPEALANIRMTASQVDHVFAVDNTEQPDSDFIESLRTVPDLTYVPLGDNLGIATALNTGVGLARDAGYSWALTMDQDSVPEKDMVAALARCASSCDEWTPIGTIAPRRWDGVHQEGDPFTGCRSMLTVITSGSLLDIAVWDDLGRFDDSLFIDQVDHDLCLRMHEHGFAVLRCGEAGMAHPIGETRKHRFLLTVYTSNHSPLRRYYITRNRFIVAQRHRASSPKFWNREMRAQKRELAKIVLFEDHKIAKLRMSWRGYRDYKRGVTGRYTA